MAAPPVSLLLLVGLLFASSVVAISFDFFDFVLMWPGAYCVQAGGGCCLPTTGQPAPDFSIRGLYPYDATNKDTVTKCNNEPFYINQLNGLRTELNKYWSNIGCPSKDPKSSWRSTWKTYGVCSNLTELDYFEAALKLHSELNILSALIKNGINPDYNLYEVEDIRAAIKNGIGVSPYIRCSVGPFKKFQVYEIHVCVAKDAATVIECPYDPGFTCKSPVLFHPYRSWMLNDTAATDKTGFQSYIEMPLPLE